MGLDNGNMDKTEKQLQDHSKLIKALEREVTRLKDILNTKDNWHAEVQGMINQQVRVVVQHRLHDETGKLLWSDRYNLCIEVNPSTSTKTTVRRVIMKGSVVSIELAE